MNKLSLISYPQLPVWQGVDSKPNPPKTAPFELVWDDTGFMHQNTDLISNISDIYAKDEYSFITPPPGASAWATRLGMQYLDYILTAVPNIKHKRILDIGGGSTFIAERLVSNTHGAQDVVIVDPALRSPLVNPQIKIVNDYFPTQAASGPFDLVISLNCFEHVPQPKDFLSGIKKACKSPETDVILIFPDIENQFKTGDLNMLLHEHISCFTSSSAELLFQEMGFAVVSSQSIEDCLYYHLRPQAKPSDKTTASQPKADVTPFIDSLNFARQDILSAINSGKRVAFHGANNGLNNTLFLSGLGTRGGFTIFDGDDFKVGKFLPAWNQPIKSSSDASYKDVDLVFISALSFYYECANFLTSKHGIDANKIRPLCPHFKAKKLL